MKRVVMIIWLWCLAITSEAQIYQTRLGKIQVTGRYKGASFTGVSNQLLMHINYDKAEMHMRLIIPDLITKNDSLGLVLNNLPGQELVFAGKMNIPFVQTKSHPRQKFATKGMLYLNGISKVFSFRSVFDHFPRGNATCIISGEFDIDLKQFNFANLLPGDEKVKIQIKQVVLKSGE